ncbi:ATP-binding protein [Streptomyces sp. NPDC058683]|uniref:ATP-binding protein n=1 Tax=Streptomyces sp. NPDC058683 TaxID=3346597 RepID=UPI003655C36E
MREAVLIPLTIVFLVLSVSAAAWRVIPVPGFLLLVWVLCGFVAAAVAGILRARSAALAITRAHNAQLQRIFEAAAALEKAVLWTADQLCQGCTPPVPESVPYPEGAGPTDEALARLDEVKWQTVVSLIRVHSESQATVVLSMMKQLSRREHALVERVLERLDQLQALTEDPDQLSVIFKIDHLATRLRRWAESKAVVAGDSLRSPKHPVNVVEVLRGAVQEIMHYSRVTVAVGTVGVEVGLPRHVGPDVTHLVAELVENATQYSDPATKVQVRAHRVARGLAIEIEDRVAIPMEPEVRERWNKLLQAPDRIDVSALVGMGQLGLLTAARIAARHEISVQLSENPTGGTTALVVVPAKRLVSLTPPPDTLARPAASAVPPVQSARPAGAAADRGEPSVPGPEQSPTAVEASGLAPLPRRVVSQDQDRMPEPARPAHVSTAPRYGLAGAFQSGVNAARNRDHTATAVPPPAHP